MAVRPNPAISSYIIIIEHETSIFISAVTPDNFLFFSVQRGEDLRKVLAKLPADKPVKIQGSDGVWYPTVKSQPIPNHYTWESKADDIAYATINLANFSHGIYLSFFFFHFSFSDLYVD